ncbi:MAG TPA: CCA tRNA nucleotidyltransferase [Thermoplasmata archaeon]|nr:MAG TPA: CCA tRNA nucleotidyltransferase [Thermoplasmata archaeon]
MRFEEDLIERIRPDAALVAKVSSTTISLMALIRDMAMAHHEVVDVRLVGSVAKETYVGRPDIDVFILFLKETPRSTLEKIGLGIGREVLPLYEERYAEHPYIHGTFDSFEVDIVPCYHIDDPSQLISAVDRTPFHTKYVLDHLLSEQRDQVRLLKQFLKGTRAYGAEARVQGFSGYLSELLIIKFKTFRKVLEASSRWNFGTKVTMTNGPSAKFPSPLVFIDPVDETRNVASALSVEQFAKFVYASQEFLASPDERFFFPLERSDMGQDAIKRYFDQTGFKVVIVSSPRPTGIDDNIYPQTRKTMEGIRTVLEQGDFHVLDKNFEIGRETRMAFLLMTNEVSQCHKHVGPPVWMDNSDVFLDRWRGHCVGEPYIEGGRWVALIRRNHTGAHDLLVKEMAKASIGSSFKGMEFSVIPHEQVISGGYESVLTELLDKRLPWTI